MVLPTLNIVPEVPMRHISRLTKETHQSTLYTYSHGGDQHKMIKYIHWTRGQSNTESARGLHCVA